MKKAPRPAGRGAPSSPARWATRRTHKISSAGYQPVPPTGNVVAGRIDGRRYPEDKCNEDASEPPEGSAELPCTIRLLFHATIFFPGRLFGRDRTFDHKHPVGEIEKELRLLLLPLMKTPARFAGVLSIIFAHLQKHAHVLLQMAELRRNQLLSPVCHFVVSPILPR